MKAIVNGDERELRDGATIAQLLRELGAPEIGIAVARNERVVARGRHASERIADGDRIEIIRAVAGG
ncbi:MAG TPA: sulfur carrier protein ThiS [Candidatus Baltobacteraceae bacterium]